MNDRLTIYADGGARGNPGPAACAVVFVKDGKQISRGSKFLGTATNNVAEYRGVIFALERLLENPQWADAEPVNFFLDSELIVNQLSGKYKIKNQNLASLSLQVKGLEKKLEMKIIYQHVRRHKNTTADFLLNQELDRHQ